MARENRERPGLARGVGCQATLIRRDIVIDPGFDPLFTGAGEDGAFSRAHPHTARVLPSVVGRSPITKTGVSCPISCGSASGTAGALREQLSETLAGIDRRFVRMALLAGSGAIRTPQFVPFMAVSIWGLAVGFAIELMRLALTRTFGENSKEAAAVKVALVCSHGGHLTEMLLVVHAWRGAESFWITYRSSRTISMSQAYLLTNIGLNPFRMAMATVRIAWILFRERPDVSISNGAEIAIPAFLPGQADRRTDHLRGSMDACLPSDGGQDGWYIRCPTISSSNGRRCSNTTAQRQGSRGDPLIFGAVGTHTAPFDRLVRALDEVAKATSEQVVVQTGASRYPLRFASGFAATNGDEFQRYIRGPELSLPMGATRFWRDSILGRRSFWSRAVTRYHEHIDDHQVELAEALGRRGLVTVSEPEDLLDAINRARAVEVRLTPVD